MTSTRSIETRTLRRRAAVALVVVLALAGCSKKVASDQGGASTSRGDRSSLVTSDLAELLPTVSNLGPEYRLVEEQDSEDTEDSGDSEFDAAIAKECPAADKVMAQEEEDSLDRSFDTTDGREVDVSVEVKEPDVADTELDDIRKAFADCKPVKYTDAAKISYTVKLGAEADKTYGDNGVLLSMDFTIDDPTEFKPITLKIKTRLFRVGQVAISLEAQSGYNQAAETEVPGDFDLLDSLADTMATSAHDLQE